ncbi:MAG: NFACT family protein [Clostridia bacterium]
MAFDGLVLKAVTQELNNCLINGKIQKIYEPNKDEILLGIYCNGMQYSLSVNVSSSLYSVYLTTTKKVNPLTAPNFCMLLRKHLMNYRISNIYSIGLERIFVIELTGKNENFEVITKKLVVELMGKYSNILLLDENNVVIDALKRFYIDNGASRNIFSKCQYIFPSSDKIDIANFKQLENNLDDTSLSEFFSHHFVGISKSFITSSLKHCASLYNNELVSKDILTKETFSILVKYILNLINSIENNKATCALANNDDYFLVSSSKSNSLEVNFFLDDYYLEKQQKEYFVSYRNNLLGLVSNILKKISKKLISVDTKLAECSDMEKYKLYGELITSNLYQIPNQNISHIELNNYYTNTLMDIPLDVAISPSENAKKYFKKYNKLKNATIIVQEQKEMLEKEINYLESIVYEIQIANTTQDLDLIYDEINNSINFKNKKSEDVKHKKTKKQENTNKLICHTIEGFTVFVGKNNVQNDELTFKIANKEDLWFHTKDIQGSHVILVTNGKTPSQEVINKCASLAAFYSKASMSSNIAVDYTLVKHIKKPSKAKPGMVIYTNQKTVNVNPQKISPSFQ